MIHVRLVLVLSHASVKLYNTMVSTSAIQPEHTFSEDTGLENVVMDQFALATALSDSALTTTRLIKHFQRMKMSWRSIFVGAEDKECCVENVGRTTL